MSGNFDIKEHGGDVKPPLFSLRGIVKRYGGFTAVDGVDLDIFACEAHGLIGENGAGKSTLVKMLFGLLEPNEGTIRADGASVKPANPDAARALGIGMVFQHFSLFDNLTVAENIALAMPGGQSMKGLPARVTALAAQYGLALDPDREVWSLSAGERQRIEIARCLLRDPRLIVLDEPTSVLTPREVEALFATLEKLKSEGRALLYISHKLDEVKRLCERATILRHGKVVGRCDPRMESARSLAALMVGAEIENLRADGARAPGGERLVAADLSLPSPDIHGVDLKEISLRLRAGEILGVAGVAGNGQSEFFAALSGETLVAPDAIRLDGEPIGAQNISTRRIRGAAFTPEERNGHAAAPNLTLADNIVLSAHALGVVAPHGLVNSRVAQNTAADVIARFDVRAAGPLALARDLSGGNLQKFVVGREIARAPGVYVVNQPTWGVDALAAAAIRQALLDLARGGAAVLVISQDLDELFEICDSIAVMRAGRLSPFEPARAITRESLGMLMADADAA